MVESAKIDAWLNQRINVRMVKLDWPTFHKRRENLLQCLFLVLHENLKDGMKNNAAIPVLLATLFQWPSMTSDHAT